jgi:hypothetical protein
MNGRPSANGESTVGTVTKRSIRRFTGGVAMTITLPPQLEAALAAEAARRGVAPEELAVDVLRERLLPQVPDLEPRDEWERRLLGLARNCGVSLPDSAVCSEGIYE